MEYSKFGANLETQLKIWGYFEIYNVVLKKTKLSPKTMHFAPFCRACACCHVECEAAINYTLFNLHTNPYILSPPIKYLLTPLTQKTQEGLLYFHFTSLFFVGLFWSIVFSQYWCGIGNTEGRE